MRKIIAFLLRKLSINIQRIESTINIQEQKSKKRKYSSVTKVTRRQQEHKEELKDLVISYEKTIRDLAETMEFPFLALSKNRRKPIIYESPNGKIKTKVTPLSGYFVPTIYDWDIILFIAGKLQEVLNEQSDIPPRIVVFPRHEILKALHKHDGKKEEKDLMASLNRLRSTEIKTTIRNEELQYSAAFSFIDSWEYTKRKEIKEIKVTISQWLYDGICAKGSLLKVAPTYFDLTSALKRFLYRTARKHIGNSQETWEFSVQKLYEKSVSEREFRKFKADLKSAVLENDIPEYSMHWIQRHTKSFVSFKRSQIEKIEHMLETIESAPGEESHKI